VVQLNHQPVVIGFSTTPAPAQGDPGAIAVGAQNGLLQNGTSAPISNWCAATNGPFDTHAKSKQKTMPVLDHVQQLPCFFGLVLRSASKSDLDQ